MGTGVSLLYYTQEWDKVRGYVSPRFGYSRTRSEAESGMFSSTLTASNYAWGVSYGVQYLPTERFGVFGEAGIGGTFGRGTASNTGNKSTGHTWGTRSGIGMVVYF